MSAPLHILDSVPRASVSTRTHCPYCAFQCGIEMRFADDSAVQITPDPDFPVNRGQMCIKGFTAGALLNHPERLTTPQLRDSSGHLVPASWTAALDFIAEHLLSIKSKYGPDAIGAFGSGALTNEKAYLLGKFVRVALGSANIDYNGRYCMSSAAAGQNKAFGIDRGLPFPVSDIAHCGAVLLWGANCADTLPPIMQYFQQQKASGGKLIVADPRCTETARSADLHLQLTPGSDLALANGLLFLGIEERLIDADYIDSRTTGFEDLRRAVLSYYPARVERLTGVSIEQMRRAVHLLANSTSSMILSGRGPEQQSKGSDTVLALINLMLALGKVGKPFSGYGCLTGQGNGQGGREHGQKSDQLPGYRLIEDPNHRAAVARAWGIDADALPRKGKSAYELFDAIGPAGIRALLVFGSNIAVASPNANHIQARLRSLDLFVVCDSFLNETTQFAHVVLPITQWAEEEGTLTNLEGRVILRRKATEAPPGVLSDIDILRELAQRLGHADKFSFATPRQVFDELRSVTAGAKADYSGITYEKIDAHDGIFWPCPSPDHPGTPRLFADRFEHPDGRARFHAVHHRPADEEPDADYPLYFTTGRYREHYNSGAQTRRVDRLIDEKPIPRLQVHPHLAARLGLTDGSRAIVESRRGRVDFEVTLSLEIRPDTVFAPFHWGGRRAANILTNPALDPTSRMPEFKLCAVRLAAIPSPGTPLPSPSPGTPGEGRGEGPLSGNPHA